MVVWRYQVSIPVPHACGARALPIELYPQFHMSEYLVFFLCGCHSIHSPQCPLDLCLFNLLAGYTATSHKRSSQRAVIGKWSARTVPGPKLFLTIGGGVQLLSFSGVSARNCSRAGRVYLPSCKSKWREVFSFLFFLLFLFPLVPSLA